MTKRPKRESSNQLGLCMNGYHYTKNWNHDEDFDSKIEIIIETQI
jgi:hypothetical protein